MADTKRRLPVLNGGGGGDGEDDDRPPWQWVGFGTMLVFAAWLPLAWAASALETRLLSRFAGGGSPEAIASAVQGVAPADAARLRFEVLLLLVLPLVIGAFVGGFIVGRWSRKAGAREAALSGLAAALVTCVLSWINAGFSPAPLAGIVLAVPMAALGGLSGTRQRSGAGVTA